MVASERQRAVALVFIGAALVALGLWGITHPLPHYDGFRYRHLFLASVLVIAGPLMFVIGLIRYWTEPKP
jgi:hypothetical protein